MTLTAARAPCSMPSRSSSARARCSGWSARAARARACSAAHWSGCCRRAGCRISGGSVKLAGRELTTRRKPRCCKVRGGEIGMIFQNPTSHLDPVMKIGDQIAEGIRFHQGLERRGGALAAIEILAQVGFPDPARQYDSYPHEFSGGMRQRAMIARGALQQSEDPDRRRADDGAGRHDTGADPAAADGHPRKARALGDPDHPRPRHRRPGLRPHRGDAARALVEVGEKRSLLAAPAHAYTRSLIASHPSLPDADAPQGREAPAPGAVPSGRHRKAACALRQRRTVPAGKAVNAVDGVNSARHARRDASASSANPAAARAHWRAPSSA